jgi:hypothetical protein
MRRKEVTTPYGKTYPAPEWYSATGAPSSRCFLPFELRHTVCSQEATYLWTRERRRARDAEARFTRCAASRDWAALSQWSCAGSVGTRNLRQAVQPLRSQASSVDRHAPEGKGGRRLMRELLVALTAFFDEHQRCGELDGGRDSGYIWLGCSCGAQIAHPATAPPPTPPEVPKLPIARMPD